MLERPIRNCAPFGGDHVELEGRPGLVSSPLPRGAPQGSCAAHPAPTSVPSTVAYRGSTRVGFASRTSGPSPPACGLALAPRLRLGSLRARSREARVRIGRRRVPRPALLKCP